MKNPVNSTTRRAMTITKNLSFLSIIALATFSCAEKRYPDPLSPEEALNSFQLHEDFEIEIYAAEPHVMDPVSMVFDASGNIYVVEMPDYPYKPEPDQGQGRIKMLWDRDGDGVIDEATVFADKIPDATNVHPWKDGLLVTAAPHIWFFTDTDGDGVADSKEALFSGFFENNSEAQITNLRFGIDNWFYAANNGQHGEVTFSEKPGEPAIPMRGADFRFRLDRGQFETATGPAQYGQTLDDWGNRFFTQNTIHIHQVVIPRRYVQRHTHLPSTASISNISDHELEMFQETPPPYWRAERTRRRNETYQEQNLDRVEHAEDHFTGASGGTIYLGDAFPEEFYGNIFTGEVAGNLVHRDVLTPHPENPTFIASRAPEETAREFLSSTDPWFRPSEFTVGPDGYLYVIDMYRQHIETPVSIPDDLKEDMDFDYGKEHGRIYRIKPKADNARKLTDTDVRSKTATEWVELLKHPNHWWRNHAQRLLLETPDKTVIPQVTALLENEDPRTRLHALYVLEGMEALNAEIVRQAIKDAHPGVREHGIRLAERYPESLPQIIEAMDDENPKVVFQATLSLGEFNGAPVVSALAKAAEQRGGNNWFRTAILSSDIGSSMDLVNQLSNTGYFKNENENKKAFFIAFSHVIGSRNQPEQVKSYLDFLSKQPEEFQKSGINGFVAGQGKTPELKERLKNPEEYAGMDPQEALKEIRSAIGF